MLSGGMDSSSIVGIARDLHLSKTGKPFRVFAAVSENNPDCRDTYFINAVLDQGGLSATTVSVEQLGDLNEEISRIVKAAQEPFDPMIMIIAIYLTAKKSGCQVMLDGIKDVGKISVASAYEIFFTIKAPSPHSALLPYTGVFAVAHVAQPYILQSTEFLRSYGVYSYSQRNRLKTASKSTLAWQGNSSKSRFSWVRSAILM